MKCFNHHDRDAFGVCKSCGKALCLECFDEVDGMLTCKNQSCREMAKIAHLGLVNMKNLYYSKNTQSAGFLVSGLCMLFGGISFFVGLNGSNIFLFLGVISLVIALCLYSRCKRTKFMK